MDAVGTSVEPSATEEAAPADHPTHLGTPQERTAGARLVGALWYSIRLGAALLLFVGALQVMKEGAASLDFLRPGGYLVRNAGSTLGLGWIGALFVLSGSPIAATSLTMVEARAGCAGCGISEIQGFTMLTGSRLGAAFVVLVTAVVYALRGGRGERLAPLSTAVMALCTTALIYGPAAILGFVLLQWEPYQALDLRFPNQFSDLIDLTYGPVIDRLSSLPGAVLFLGGLGALLLSFKIIDTVLPHLDDHAIEHRPDWLRRKWPMFALGCAVALVTMSVSVALTILVPLVSKGYAKRKHILPYIIGANITTLGDTLLAAFALDSPAAVRIVLAGIISTTILSLVILTFFYHQVRKGIWRLQERMVASKPRLATFTAALFAIPLAVIVISGSVV